jgi:CHAT domain-containing protein
MHTAGFRHVVGTLWPADDQTSAAVAGDFYARLTAQQRGEGAAGDASGAGRALHAAVQTVRAAHPKVPTYWANHVHYGP